MVVLYISLEVQGAFHGKLINHKDTKSTILPKSSDIMSTYTSNPLKTIWIKSIGLTFSVISTKICFRHFFMNPLAVGSKNDWKVWVTGTFENRISMKVLRGWATLHAFKQFREVFFLLLYLLYRVVSSILSTTFHRNLINHKIYK